MTPAEFAAWLKKTRELIGRSAQDVADILNVSVQTVHNWEREEKPTRPQDARLPEIARAYGLPPDSLAGVLGKALAGPSLDYWVGRWEQQTMHFRRLLADQEELLSLMRERSRDSGNVRPDWVTREDLDGDDAVLDALEAAAAARKKPKNKKATG